MAKRRVASERREEWLERLVTGPGTGGDGRPQVGAVSSRHPQTLAHQQGHLPGTDLRQIRANLRAGRPGPGSRGCQDVTDRSRLPLRIIPFSDIDTNCTHIQ